MKVDENTGWRRLARYALVLAALLLVAIQASSHNVGQVQTTKFFAPATVSLLKARAAGGAAGFVVGDTIEYIIQFTPVANGVNSSYGANGYLTDYIPPGTEVIQASFVTLTGYDASGDPVFTNVAPDLPGLMPTGWGANPQTFAASSANFNVGSTYDTTGFCAGAGFSGANCRSRLSEEYADTGIFYSTDARTAQNPAQPSRVLQGISGNGYTLGSMTRGGPLMLLLSESVNTVHNLWDACMGRAFGGGASNALCSPNTAVSTQGPTPFRAGSPVAGPQTGYPLDYTGQVGPWQRIQYNGSRIGDPSLGPARNMTQPEPVGNNATGWNATAPLTLSAGGMSTNQGYALSPSNPLPAGTNAVRYAIGKLTVGQINYVKISLRVTQPVGAAGITNGSEVFGGDSSNLTGNTLSTSASIDNPWTYLVPSVADNNSNLFVSKTLCVYDAAAATCAPLSGTTVPPASTLTYKITYLNTGNLNQTNVQLLDRLPCQAASSATGMKIGFVAGPMTSVITSVPYTTATTAGANCSTGTETRNTVTFASMGTLAPGAGGSLIVNVRNTTPAGSGTPTINTAILKSTDVPSGVVSNAVTYVGSSTVNTNPSLAISKSTITPNVTAGGTAQFVITVQNTAVSAITTLTIADILPTAGTTADPTTRFNYKLTNSIQSSGLTTATALVTSTTTAAAYAPATALTPYNTQAGAANAVVANWYFGSSTLAAGGIITITFTVDVGSQVPASQTPYLNSVRAMAGTTTAPFFSIDASNVAGVTVSSPLALSKTLSCYYSGASCVAPGPSGNLPNNAKARYNVAWANTGVSAIANATVTDTLPCQISAATGLITMTAVVGPIPGAFATTAATTGNCPATAQTLTLGSTASLAANTSGSFSYEVQLTTPSSTSSVVTNAATIAGTGVASATAQVQNGVVSVANLQITKTASPTSVVPGGTLLYTITIVNNGTAPAATLTVYDWLPTGTSTTADTTRRFSYTPTATVSGVVATATVSASAPPTQAPYSVGTYAANQQQVTFAFPVAVSIPVGGTLTITVPASVGSNLPALAAPNYYYNNAAVVYNNGLSAASNAATANVTLVANLSATKNNGTTTLAAGSSTTYTVTFANAGPSAADGATVKDTASAGLSCTAVTCSSTTGGASCPSGMTLGVPVNVGSTTFFSTGTTIPTFPGTPSSSVVLSVACGVTATGQ